MYEKVYVYDVQGMVVEDVGNLLEFYKTKIIER